MSDIDANQPTPGPPGIVTDPNAGAPPTGNDPGPATAPVAPATPAQPEAAQPAPVAPQQPDPAANQPAPAAPAPAPAAPAAAPAAPAGDQPAPPPGGGGPAPAAPPPDQQMHGPPPQDAIDPAVIHPSAAPAASPGPAHTATLPGGEHRGPVEQLPTDAVEHVNPAWGGGGHHQHPHPHPEPAHYKPETGHVASTPAPVAHAAPAAVPHAAPVPVTSHPATQPAGGAQDQHDVVIALDAQRMRQMAATLRDNAHELRSTASTLSGLRHQLGLSGKIEAAADQYVGKHSAALDYLAHGLLDEAHALEKWADAVEHQTGG